MVGPDLKVINSEILTMNESQPFAQAVAIKNGCIEAIGSNEEIMAISGKDDITLNMEGKTILPGFIDSHTHFMQTGMANSAVDLTGAHSSEEILKAVEKEALKGKEFIRGAGYDDSVFPGKTPPTRWELDLITSGRTVWLNRIDSHSCIVNTETLNLLNLPAGIEGVDLDANGNPTGILRSAANNLARQLLPGKIDEKTRWEAMNAAANNAAKAGITSLYALEGGGQLFNDEDAEYLIAHKHKLDINVDISVQTTDVNRVRSLGLSRIGGCIIIDGSFGSRTAALQEPYADDPNALGVLYFSQKEMDDFVLEAHSAGLQIMTHVIGERAIEQILKAYKRALEIYPRSDHRHRLEHAELITIDQASRIKEMGLILSMQPPFEYYWGGPDKMYGIRLGQRWRRTNPFRTLLDMGVMVAGGSDSDVTPMSPLLGIHAAVNHPNPKQRVSVMEGLQMFTVNGAYACFAEGQRGSLVKGKLADMVVLDKNPLDAPEMIKDINVVMTLAGGKVIYNSEKI